ncbi:rCG41515 [Rattus norvegicus]|uniref:RCG41515 n=1 Tax=Rattus norvegicus TaxID=10116 RepID=A6IHN4_RAT|nr:rCG41515 [Rattus norvegicus]
MRLRNCFIELNTESPLQYHQAFIRNQYIHESTQPR